MRRQKATVAVTLAARYEVRRAVVREKARRSLTLTHAALVQACKEKGRAFVGGTLDEFIARNLEAETNRLYAVEMALLAEDEQTYGRKRTG